MVHMSTSLMFCPSANVDLDNGAVLQSDSHSKTLFTGFQLIMLNSPSPLMYGLFYPNISSTAGDTAFKSHGVQGGGNIRKTKITINFEKK